jgi:hypothetical protein
MAKMDSHRHGGPRTRYVIGYYLMVGFLLALVPWLLARTCHAGRGR